jgi:PAS domain S-box-containing protein
MLTELDPGLGGTVAPLLVLDDQGRILVWNQACAHLTGHVFEEVRGKYLWDCVAAPDEERRVREGVRRLLAGDSTCPLEGYLLDKAGRRRWMEWLLHVVRRSDGSIDFVSAVGFDRTDAKQAEYARGVSAAIVARLDEAILAVDGEQRIVLCNEGAARLLGWPRDELLGKTFDVVLPRQIQKIYDLRRASGSLTLLARRKSGERFFAETSVAALEVDGAPLSALVLRDATDQRRAAIEQQFLAELGSALSTTLDVGQVLTNVAELAVRFLADCCIIHCIEDDNSVRTRVVHADRRKADLAEALERLPLEHRLLQMARPAGEAQSSGVREATREQLGSLDEGDEYVRLLGQLGPATYLGLPLIAQGRMLGAVVLVCSDPARRRDAGEVKLAQELARRAARTIECARLYRSATHAADMRQDVLGVVAHDLRTPICAARLAAQCLVREDAHERRKSTRRSVDLLMRALDRASRLVDDLLQMTQVEAGRMTLDLVRLAPDQIITDVLETFAAAASAAAVSMDSDVRGPLPLVFGDQHRIHQLFSNLVANALKFTRGGGRIWIGAEGYERGVRFWVRDTGCGIHAEDIPHLFDRFWQSRQSYRRGVGLGLGIARGIVAAHGGRIWVQSTPGAGSTFSFTLSAAPLDKSPRQLPSTSPEAKARTFAGRR